VTIASELKPGLFAARTLLSDNDRYAALRFIHVSGVEHVIPCDLCLGEAVPGLCLSDGHYTHTGENLSADTVTGGGGSGVGISLAPSAGHINERLTADRGTGAQTDKVPKYYDAGKEAGESRDSGESQGSAVCRPDRGHLSGCATEIGCGYVDQGNTGDSTGQRLEVRDTVEADPSDHTVDGSHIGCFDCGDYTCRVANCESLSENDRVNLVTVDTSCDCDEGEFAYLKPIIDVLPENLSDEQMRIAVDLILHNAGVFSKHEYDLGRTHLLYHTIDIVDRKPFAQPLRSLPRVYLDTIDQAVDYLLKIGVTEPASSPWASNIVVVAKPGNPIPRITVDYR
jgi:hypothetical protein